MANGTDFLSRLITGRKARTEMVQLIKDIEELLERLTSVQDSLRSDTTLRGRKMKEEVDHLVRLVMSGASVVYAKELKEAL